MSLPNQPAPILAAGQDDPLHAELTALHTAIASLRDAHATMQERIAALETAARDAPAAAVTGANELAPIIEAIKTLADHLGLAKLL